MSPRLLLASGVALLLLGVGMGAVTAISDSNDPVPPPQFAGAVRPENLRATNFTLTDQDGHRFPLASTRGRVVALTFIHSKCTSTCPVTLQTIRGALDDLEDTGSDPSEVDVLAVTVDPEADTRRSVRRFLKAQRADSFVRYLTGPRARMLPIWKRYGIGPQGTGAEDHTAFVLLIDRKGNLRIGWPAHQMTAEQLANDLRILLAEDPPA
jgi:protein SCO1/2